MYNESNEYILQYLDIYMKNTKITIVSIKIVKIYYIAIITLWIITLIINIYDLR